MIVFFTVGVKQRVYESTRDRNFCKQPTNPVAGEVYVLFRADVRLQT